MKCVILANCSNINIPRILMVLDMCGYLLCAKVALTVRQEKIWNVMFAQHVSCYSENVIKIS